MLNSVAVILGVPLVLALLTPFVSRWAKKGVLRQEKEEAMERLVADPHVFVGAVMSGIYVVDRAEPLVPRCFITRFDVEGIVVQISDKNHPHCGHEHTWTLMEFEKLHPRMVPEALLRAS